MVDTVDGGYGIGIGQREIAFHKLIDGCQLQIVGASGKRSRQGEDI
ncbi:hypothetical protein Barb7_01858 [Bacteroidales bacterium Barb7]|nr:hypothetical protein Barb7_01858 [Bacteroidales bacterium Barb7]